MTKIPVWLRIIIDWRESRRKKELANLDAKLAQVKNELIAAREENKRLEKVRSTFFTLK